MFSDSGEKLKSIAKFVTIVGTIVSVIIGCLSVESRHTLLWGIVLLIIGPFLSWIGGLVLYCLGDSFDKICEIKKTLNDSNETEKDCKPENQD